MKKISFIEKDSRVVFSGELTLLTIDNSFEKKSKALIKSGVTFDNLPKDLLKLAQLSCVDMFLPKTDSTLNQ